MKKIIFLISFFFAISCEKENEKPNNFVVDVNVEFNVLATNMIDLLNSETPEYYPIDSMQLYYLIGDDKIAVKDFDPQIGGNNGIMVITETNPNRLVCFTYSHGDEGFTHEENGIKIGIAIAYLEFNENDTDTIKTEWAYKEGSYFINRKVWYNGVLHSPTDSVFQVIKSI